MGPSTAHGAWSVEGLTVTAERKFTLLASLPI